MRRVISSEDAKVVIDLLLQKRPRIFDDFNSALGIREFDVRKLLKRLEAEGIIIRESYSGEEKFWLNESQAFDFMRRNPVQKKRLKHGR